MVGSRLIIDDRFWRYLRSVEYQHVNKNRSRRSIADSEYADESHIQMQGHRDRSMEDSSEMAWIHYIGERKSGRKHKKKKLIWQLRIIN